MNGVPESALVRRREAMDRLGVDKRVFTALVQSGIISVFAPKARGKRPRSFYYREQLELLARQWRKENQVKHD